MLESKSPTSETTRKYSFESLNNKLRLESNSTLRSLGCLISEQSSLHFSLILLLERPLIELSPLLLSRSAFEAEQLEGTQRRLQNLQKSAQDERAALVQLVASRAALVEQIEAALAELKDLKETLQVTQTEAETSQQTLEEVKKASAKSTKVLDRALKEIGSWVSGSSRVSLSRASSPSLTSIFLLLPLERHHRATRSGESSHLPSMQIRGYRHSSLEWFARRRADGRRRRGESCPFSPSRFSARTDTSFGLLRTETVPLPWTSTRMTTELRNLWWLRTTLSKLTLQISRTMNER